MSKVSINTRIANTINRTNSVESFLRDTRKYPVMTKEETTNAFIRLNNGDETAREEIFNSNLLFMFSLASKFAKGDNILDLVGEMSFGMQRAIDTFEYQKGYTFLSYAVHWLYASITAYFEKYSTIVKSTNSHLIGNKAHKAGEKFFAENGRMPSEEELMDILESEYNLQIKNRTDLVSVKAESMDGVIDEDGTTVGEVGELAVTTATHNEYEDTINAEHNAHCVDAILSRIPLKNREIIEMYFGVGKYDGMAMDKDAIAEKLGCTSERVRQIIEGSLSKLRDMAKRGVIAWV